ncbi:hypothetical protein [Mycolicibacterium goodii]|uniref:Uncharacterized protein n=1 Tax=Mycolicibacterium goodii TaxID=134601 RepID=A0ABS6HYT3_MYCGD|nr:hypothetical protein [Mycolicibacterium goodii]MBU8814327.1 hypothetical protein [Mycolicibacterium goodii]MBU8827730.1 hypothetical protein [Mycolicibacterium goodii]MBU8841392.1 hypothetical protein [Mycolicibacterium goodii]
MGKGARIRKQREQERERQAALEAALGLAGLQPQGAPFGATPPWKKPTTVDEAVDQMKQFMQSMPQLIVCGRLGLTPLTETQRHELLSNVNLFDALETVARLQGRWDIAITTTQRPDLIEAEFLAAGTGEACRRARKRVIEHRDLLVSPRATAQLQREIIENASEADTAEPIDRNTLVHILLSITSEQNSHPAFAGDVPTPEEIAKFEREMPKMNMTELLEYAQKFIPDEVASNLYNMPSMYEMVLSNTYDLWFTPWAERSKTTGLGATPAEAFKTATSVELLDLLRLGHRIVKRSKASHQVRFTRDELVADGASDAAIDYLVAHMSLTLEGYKDALNADRQAGDIAHQRFTFTQFPFIAVDQNTIVMIRHQWAMERLCGATLYNEAWHHLATQSSTLGHRFKTAMNDAFEVFVGGILHRIARKGKGIQKIVDEADMQAAWTEQKDNMPSICDWMMLGEGHCVVIDATNHAVKADAAQGLATFDEYAADIDKIYIEGKFKQLLSTIDLAKKHGGWDGEVVNESTNFVPLVVIPDTGVPSGIITNVDITERGRTVFQHLQPHVYPAGLITVAAVQLLEGLADIAVGLPQGPGDDRNMMKLIAGWRHAVISQGDTSLQMFLHRRGFPLFLSQHILRNSRKVMKLLDAD